MAGLGKALRFYLRSDLSASSQAGARPAPTKRTPAPSTSKPGPSTSNPLPTTSNPAPDTPLHGTNGTTAPQPPHPHRLLLQTRTSGGTSGAGTAPAAARISWVRHQGRQTCSSSRHHREIPGACCEEILGGCSDHRDQHATNAPAPALLTCPNPPATRRLLSERLPCVCADRRRGGAAPCRPAAFKPAHLHAAAGVQRPGGAVLCAPSFNLHGAPGRRDVLRVVCAACSR